MGNIGEEMEYVEKKYTVFLYLKILYIWYTFHRCYGDKCFGQTSDKIY